MSAGGLPGYNIAYHWDVNDIPKDVLEIMVDGDDHWPGKYLVGGAGHDLGARQIYDIVRLDPALNSSIKRIRLDACYAGEGKENSLAEHLAIKFGITVRASITRNIMTESESPDSGHAEWQGKVYDFEPDGTIKFIRNYPIHNQ